MHRYAQAGLSRLCANAPNRACRENYSELSEYGVIGL